MMDRTDANAATAWLRQRKLRVTQGRIFLVTALLRAHTPLTLAELQAQASKCDFATVFRFINILEKRHFVQRHSWGDRQLRYELQEDEAHHHHHLICRICHRVETVDRCLIKHLHAELTKEKGYTDLSHSLEFFGICPRCQKKTRKINSRNFVHA